MCIICTMLFCLALKWLSTHSPILKQIDRTLRQKIQPSAHSTKSAGTGNYTSPRTYQELLIQCNTRDKSPMTAYSQGCSKQKNPVYARQATTGHNPQITRFTVLTDEGWSPQETINIDTRKRQQHKIEASNHNVSGIWSNTTVDPKKLGLHLKTQT